MMTIRLNPANLAQTRSDLGLTIGTSNGNVIAADTTGLPAINGSQVTALNASNLSSGTVPTARLGSGTASGTTFLAGDQTYKTVAAGLNHITTVTASDSGNISINSTLTDTYNSYLVTLANLVPATNNVEMRSTFSSDNGTSYISSNYQYVYKSFYLGPSGDGNTESTGNSYISLVNSGNSTAGDGGTSGNIYIYSPTNSAVRTAYMWDFNSRMGDGSNFRQRTVGAGVVGSTTDNDAFKIFFSSGNVASGTVRVYGIANS